MKKTILAAVVIALFAISTGKQATATLLDFDDFIGVTFLTDQFASEGIIFDGAWVQIGLIPSRGSAPNWISGEMVTNNLSNPDVISGYFVNPSDPSQNATTDFFQVLSVFADSDTTVIVDVFDLDGLLLSSVSRIDDGISSISTANIHSFALYHVNSGFNGIDDIFGFDNMVFNAVTPLPAVSPIPLPAALPLFLAALGGLGFFGWRKRRPALA